jgi:aspartate/methionine/tyrosine aminotransferase
VTEDFNPAPYMRWAKFRHQARYDLTGSNLVPCDSRDAPGLLDDLPLTGPGPDGYPPLFEAIAHRYGVDPSGIALATGCSGANFLVCAALLRAGDEVVIEHPVYDPLPAAARIVGAHVVHFERCFEDRWSVDPDRVARAMTRHTRLVIISSPHNPTGVIVPPDVIRALGELVEQHDAWLLVDEVYRDATYGRDSRSSTPAHTPAPAHKSGAEQSMSSAHAHPRCIVTNSLTKSYGLPGLRCGWAMGGPEVIERIRRTRDAVDAVGSYPAEVASARAFAMIELLAARARAIIEPNLERLSQFMESRNDLAWVRPDGGTVAFPRFPGSSDAESFVDRLLHDQETAVVPGRFFGAAPHFRIAFGVQPDTLEHGLEAIGRVLGR